MTICLLEITIMCTEQYTAILFHFIHWKMAIYWHYYKLHICNSIFVHTTELAKNDSYVIQLPELSSDYRIKGYIM